MSEEILRVDQAELELSQLVQQYSKLLYVVALSVLGKQANREDLEELVSDVFIRFWQNPQKYQPEKGSLKNYLVLLTKSMALNQLKRNRRMFLPLTEFPIEELPKEMGATEDVWDDFFEALLLIDEPTREICLQRYFYELKPKIIAENMQLSVKEVHNRLYQGKKKIRQVMERQMYYHQLDEK
ncbi:MULTISPECIES: sigma-70 family RNA polymerase sigma factor [unclassified Enterococcus]|uniref:RNA polymerase sigma factor n=1 Tax=unclassified Enterococcus TaxID=2608891 RepID=UPI002474C57A|nr:MULTISPECIES: sigma-70 family RNA polymerase sigma factor [unclassified Enterococcus]